MSLYPKYFQLQIKSSNISNELLFVRASVLWFFYCQIDFSKHHSISRIDHMQKKGECGYLVCLRKLCKVMIVVGTPKQALTLNSGRKLCVL